MECGRQLLHRMQRIVSINGSIHCMWWTQCTFQRNFNGNEEEESEWAIQNWRMFHEFMKNCESEFEREREIWLIDCIGQASLVNAPVCAVSVRQYYFKFCNDLHFRHCLWTKNVSVCVCAFVPRLSLMGQNFSDATELSDNQVQER